jgi:hypothetical protein
LDNIASEGASVEKGGSAPQPFYNEFTQINDPKVAEDIAYVEKDQGRDAAILRENALREEYETGLTEKERENSEIANMLVGEFPDAFVESVDDNGAKIFTTGLRVVRYGEVISESRLLREELLEDLAIIDNEMRMWEPSDGKIILNSLIKNARNVHISKYGISIGLNFIYYEDSIKVFSDEELETFFKALKFLDKVGKIKKEIAIEKGRQSKSVDDLRNLAQQIKNS